MRYRLTCLTPLLVGTPQAEPIDYMVWKDHVNVLDQWRIFRLLAKGPRWTAIWPSSRPPTSSSSLPGRLRAEFRRPPHPVRKRGLLGLLEPRRRREPAYTDVRRRSFRPLPARRRHQRSLRTGMLFANWRDGMLQDVAQR